MTGIIIYNNMNVTIITFILVVAAATSARGRYIVAAFQHHQHDPLSNNRRHHPRHGYYASSSSPIMSGSSTSTSSRMIMERIPILIFSQHHHHHHHHHPPSPPRISSSTTTTTALQLASSSAASSLAQDDDADDDKVSLEESTTTNASSSSSTATSDNKSSAPVIDPVLLVLFVLWYVGNYYYKVTNKIALNAAGGKTGFPMTISMLQLLIGSIFALLTWIPTPKSRPTVTKDDLIKMIPVGFCLLGSHSASIFAFSAGAVSFAEIVKAAEPAFAAVLSQFAYNRPVSTPKWLCLPIIIGGVILVSVKELSFTWTALIAGCIANMFAAVKGNENKKLIDASGGIKDRIGSVKNQFALTTILAFLMSIPFMIAKEGSRFGEFINLATTTPVLWQNILFSALWYYNYNDVATRTLKKTGAVTQSVANTAKRVLVIVGAALYFAEPLPPIKLIGSAICIGGVFLYSIIDRLVDLTKKSSSSSSESAPSSATA